MKSGEGLANKFETVSDLKPSKSQSRDVRGRKNETQTFQKNPSKKPIEVDRAEGRAAQSAKLSDRSGTNRLMKGADQQSQKSFLLSFQGGQSQSRFEVVRNKAQQRWEKDLMRQGIEHTGVIMDWLTNETIQRATEAELTKPGGGLEFILSEMGSQQISA